MPSTLDQIILEETQGTFQGKPDKNGLYDVGGVKFPKAAIGQGAVVFFQNADGSYDVLCSQRAGHLVHGNQWGLSGGGYLDIQNGEGPLQGIWREMLEETKGIVDLRDTIPFRTMQPFVDYEDRFNGAAFNVQYMFVLNGEKARTTRAALEKAMAAGSFDSEVKNFAFVPVQGLETWLDAKEAAREFGYRSSARALRMAARHFREYKPPALMAA